MRNAFFEAGGNDVERDAQFVAERLQVGSVGFVVDVFHTDVEGLDGKVGHKYLGATGHEFEQA